MPTVTRPRIKPLTRTQAAAAIIYAARPRLSERIADWFRPYWRQFQDWRDRYVFVAPCPSCAGPVYRRRLTGGVSREDAENCTMHYRNAKQNGGRW